MAEVQKIEEAVLLFRTVEVPFGLGWWFVVFHRFRDAAGPCQRDRRQEETPEENVQSLHARRLCAADEFRQARKINRR